jgi:hypothetical protein
MSKDMRPPAPNDLTTLSPEEILRFLSENRAWNKRLREETNTLVNARLSQKISSDEYAGIRRRAVEDLAECRRREAILFRAYINEQKNSVPLPPA